MGAIHLDLEFAVALLGPRFGIGSKDKTVASFELTGQSLESRLDLLGILDAPFLASRLMRQSPQNFNLLPVGRPGAGSRLPETNGIHTQIRTADDVKYLFARNTASATMRVLPTPPPEGWTR